MMITDNPAIVFVRQRTNKQQQPLLQQMLAKQTNTEII